jgi:DNA polymerase III delta prime subunit
MITGPPGIGKTTSAHLCAKLAGFTPIEVNASDSRSKKLVEVSIFLSCETGLKVIFLSPCAEWNQHGQYIIRWMDGPR